MFRSLYQCGIAIIVCTALANGQKPNEGDDALDRRIGEFELKDRTFFAGLIELAGQCKFPLGIEWIQDFKLQRMTRSWRDAKISSILDDILKSEPQYSWKMIGGVVHVYHRKLFADERNFLNLGIEKFSSHATYPEIDGMFFKHVLRMVRPPEIRLNGGIANDGPGGIAAAAPIFKFSVENVPIRDALNKLILEAPHSKIWIVTFPEPEILTANGFLDVAPIANASRADRRFWSRLSWGSQAPWLLAPPRE